MYFSRVRINQHPSALKHWVESIKADIYNVHQLLWKLFPNEKKRSFLFYQELRQKSLKNDFSQAYKNLPIFYLVSVIPPQLLANLFIVDTKPYMPALEKGQVFNFTVRANPVVTIRREGCKNSAHHDVLLNAKKKAVKNGVKSDGIWFDMEKAALDWFINRAPSQWGFSVNPQQILIDAYQHHYLKKSRQKDSIQFSTIDYSGILTVEDPAKFQYALFNGIGRAKAFGCGLILIRPRVG